MSFFAAVAVLVLLAAGFVLYPFIASGRVIKTRDSNTENIDIYRRNLAELEALVSASEISAEDYRERKDELDVLLLADYEQPDTDAVGHLWGKGPGVALYALGLVIAVAAYWQLGAWQAVNLSDEYARLMHSEASNDLETAELLGRITRYAGSREDSGSWWYLAASSYAGQGNYAAAAEGYRRSLDQWPEDPRIWAELGQSLYLANERQMVPEAAAALARAIKLDPHQVTAQGVLGIHAFERGDFAAAINAWEQALRALPPMSSQARTLSAGIAQARAAQGAPGQEQSADSTALGPDIPVSVSLGEAVPVGGSVVYVIARIPGGPPMPLAVRRLPSGGLPVAFTLSDADAMQAGMGISSQPRVELVARLSQSGNPVAQPGDWQSAPVVVDVAAPEPVELVINQPVE